MKTAILQTAFLGDVVFTAPLTRALSERWPGAGLALVVRPPADQIARHLPGVTQVIPYDRHGTDRGWKGLLGVGERLRAFAPDAVIALPGSPRLGFLAVLSGAATRLGPAESPAAPLFTQSEPLEGLPFVEQSVALARALGVSATPDLALRLPESLEAQGRALVPAGSVALLPGSEWETKRWPIARMAELAVALAAEGRRPVLLGSPSERGLSAALNVLSGGVCLDLTGNRVEEALAVLSACAAVVGGDSGLTHAARALGVACVALFGPTTPAAHVWRAGERALSLRLPCSPCSAHGSRRCPLVHHRCLLSLEPERVLAALRAQLS